jgi:hypothetical protein
MKGGVGVKCGNMFDLVQESPWLRVAHYYMNVSDNGIFYGLMRAEAIRRVQIVNALGGDWVAVAGLSFVGKLKMIDDVAVHRELGGATASFRSICASLGISSRYAMFPVLSIASAAFWNIVFAGKVYRERTGVERLFWGTTTFAIITARAAYRYACSAVRTLREFVKRAVT